MEPRRSPPPGAGPGAPSPRIRGYDARDPAPAQPRQAPRRDQPDRRRMLDIRREGHLKYDLREVLQRSALPPEQWAGFTATVISKGTRQSTGEAKDFVTGKMNETLITKTDRDAINTLLDRYSKWR